MAAVNGVKNLKRKAEDPFDIDPISEEEIDEPGIYKVSILKLFRFSQLLVIIQLITICS